jgi:hypothetical protein
LALLALHGGGGKLLDGGAYFDTNGPLNSPNTMASLRVGSHIQKRTSSQRRLGSMAYGAIYHMSFLRTMDPSLRWDDELKNVATTPKQTLA